MARFKAGDWVLVDYPEYFSENMVYQIERVWGQVNFSFVKHAYGAKSWRLKKVDLKTHKISRFYE